jgi:hypothetical protein
VGAPEGAFAADFVAGRDVAMTFRWTRGDSGTLVIWQGPMLYHVLPRPYAAHTARYCERIVRMLNEESRR